MSEGVTLDRVIHEAIEDIERFSGPVSEPLDFGDPSSVSERIGRAISDVTDRQVLVGVTEDWVVIVDPGTSKVLQKKPISEASAELIASVRLDRNNRRDIYRHFLEDARYRTILSLAAASLGFLIVLGGIIAMLSGFSTAGLVTSAAGIVCELVSVLFFSEARNSSKRLDNTLEQLLKAEGDFRASELIKQLPEGPLRNQATWMLIKQIMGISDLGRIIED